MRTVLISMGIGLLAFGLLGIWGCGGSDAGDPTPTPTPTSTPTPTATFSITAAAKTMAHPYFGMGHPVGYVVDGAQGAVISLTRGVTYTFNVNATGHPFYFTTDPTGGPGMPGRITTGVANDLVDNGAVTFTPDASHPAMFWYQCNAHTHMGWHVVLTP